MPQLIGTIESLNVAIDRSGAIFRVQVGCNFLTSESGSTHFSTQKDAIVAACRFIRRCGGQFAPVS